MPKTTVVVAGLGQLEGRQVASDSDNLIDRAKLLQKSLAH